MLTSSAFQTNNGPLTPDIVSAIFQNFPDAEAEAPLYAELLRLNLTAPANQFKFEWRNGALPVRSDAVNNGGAAYDENTTAIVVDTPSVFYPGAVVLCEATREIILVTAVNTGTSTLTVRRGLGSVVAAAAASVANNALLRVIGPAAGEGANAFTSRETALGVGDNYTQIIRKTVELSGTLAGSKTLTENTMEYERKIKFEEAIRDLEQMIYFGTKGSTTDADGKTVRTSAGLHSIISTNVFNVGGALTLTYLEDTYLPQLFAVGSRRKTAFCGNLALATFVALYRGRIRTSINDGVGGSRLDIISTNHGDLVLKNTRGLSGAFSGSALVLDIGEDTKLRHLPRVATKDRPATNGLLTLVESIQDKGADAVKDEWFAELGFQFGREAAHGRFSGITGAA